jgi:hypothetical protein
MFSKSHSLLLAAAMLAAPMATAMAQGTNPTGNMGSNRSVTASPGTADSKAVSGMNTGDVGAQSTAGTTYNPTAANPYTPGGTGTTVVPGTMSSQAGSTAGTAQQQTGTTTGGGSK